MPFRRNRYLRPRRFTIFRRGAKPLEMLARANQLLTSGQANEAAELFSLLAGVMESSGNLRKSVNLKARAAHAYLESGQAKPALDQARLALRGFLQLGMQARAASFFDHITQAFAMDGVGEAVDWIDRQTAECVYCGSVIRVQV